MYRSLAMLAACAGTVVAAGPSMAQQAPRLGDGTHGGFLQLIAHKHWHKDGHGLLGERLHHEGRHELEKLKGRSVVAEVRHGKVEKMDAQDLAMKRVKTNRKMAMDGSIIRADYAPMQLAQADQAYYGYCFDDGVEYNCYWYPASDVNYQDYTWEPYDPTY